jgi:hypothetical protein
VIHVHAWQPENRGALAKQEDGIAPTPVASAVAVAARISSSIHPSYRTERAGSSVLTTQASPGADTDVPPHLCA